MITLAKGQFLTLTPVILHFKLNLHNNIGQFFSVVVIRGIVTHGVKGYGDLKHNQYNTVQYEMKYKVFMLFPVLVVCETTNHRLLL